MSTNGDTFGFGLHFDCHLFLTAEMRSWRPRGKAQRAPLPYTHSRDFVRSVRISNLEFHISNQQTGRTKFLEPVASDELHERPCSDQGRDGTSAATIPIPIVPSGADQGATVCPSLRLVPTGSESAWPLSAGRPLRGARGPRARVGPRMAVPSGPGTRLGSIQPDPRLDRGAPAVLPRSSPSARTCATSCTRSCG